MSTQNTPQNPVSSDAPGKETGFAKQKDMGIFHEFMLFLWQNKLWWMIPIIIILCLLIAMMTFAAQSGTAAPFIYTLF